MLDRVTMILIFIAGFTLTVLAGHFGHYPAIFKAGSALIILVGTVPKVEEYWAAVLEYIALAEFTTVTNKQPASQPDTEQLKDILYAIVFIFVLFLL